MAAIIVAIMVVIIVIIISRLFKSGSLNLKNNEAIENFSMHIATDSNLVKKRAIEILLDIKQRKNIRANQRKLNVQERNGKGYNKYNWEELTENGGLNKLTVSELDKYLNYHCLPKSGKNLEKIKRITCHTWRPNTGQVQSLVTAQSICYDTDTTSDDSEEEIVQEFGSLDDTSDGELHPLLITNTSSGRVAGT